MSDRREQIADIVDELIDNITDLVQINCGTKVQNYREIANKQRTSAIKQLFALLPSPEVKEWVKVEECQMMKDLGNIEDKQNQCRCTPCPNGCHGTGTISTPLKWEDVDWNNILVTLKILSIKG